MWWSLPCVIFTLWIFFLRLFFPALGVLAVRSLGACDPCPCLRGKGEYSWGEEGTCCVCLQILGLFGRGKVHLCWVKWEALHALGFRLHNFLQNTYFHWLRRLKVSVTQNIFEHKLHCNEWVNSHCVWYYIACLTAEQTQTRYMLKLEH